MSKLRKAWSWARQHPLAVLTVFALSLTPASVWIVARNELRFAPVIFMNEFLSILIGRYGPVLAGFYLARIFWDRRVQTEAVDRLRLVIREHLHRIGRMAWETNHALATPVSDIDSTFERERFTYSNIRRSDDICSAILLLSTQVSASRDLGLIQAVMDIQADAHPIIRTLLEIENLVPGNQDLISGLSRLGQSVDRISAELQRSAQ